MLFKVSKDILKTFTRGLHSTLPALSVDARGLRMGHVKKNDSVEGEQGARLKSDAIELIDENVYDKVIGDAKFKDIPALYIRCTRNNTKITLTSREGRKIEIYKTCGMEGYKHCRKGTTVAAQAVAKRVLSYANDCNISTVRVVFDGLGPGRSAAYKVFEDNLRIVSLSDRTEAQEPWVRRPRAAKSI